MRVILQRWAPRALAALFVTFVGLLALLPVTQVSAAPSAAKVCTLTGSNVYTCTYSITPSVATGPGPWSVQMVSPGPGTFTGTSTVVSASGCTNVPTIGAGSFISTPSGTADYDVVIGSGGCTATATVVVTETVTVTASGQICQRVWVTAGFAPVTTCATVVFTPVTSTPTPSAVKSCTLTSTPNVYTCLFTVTPAFPAAPGDVLHINEPPGPPMTGPGTFTSTPTVQSVSGCAETPAPVVLSSATSYHATIGVSGCPGTAWSVTFSETLAVTASGQICQSFYMVAAVPPATGCATVVFTPTVFAPSASKSCTLTTTPNVYTCTFTITPSVAALPGDQWLVQMVSPGPGTFTPPAPVVSSATTGCGSGSALPTITAGTLINTTLGTANYNVTIGSAGCSAAATVVITETVLVTASGQICQRVWINAAFSPITSCAQVVFTCSCVTGVAGMPPASIVGSVPQSGGFGLVVFGGGTLQQLVAATGCPPGTMALWITVNGGFVIYVPGTSISAVNAAFMASFPSGTIPPITPFIAKCV